MGWDKLEDAQECVTDFTNPLVMIETSNHLNEVIGKVPERRKHWKETAKSIVKEILQTIVNHSNSDLEVQDEDDWKDFPFIDVFANRDFVNIKMVDNPSGITRAKFDNEGKPIEREHFVLTGGYLAYSQSFNGKIVVFIGYPRL